MTSGPLSSSPGGSCDLERFRPEQAEQISALLHSTQQQLQALSPNECQTLRTIWTMIAQTSAPIAISATSRQSDADVQRTLDGLSAAGLIWYDADLRCVLQCPPFSALTTNHSVKAFGWNSSQVCSLIDAPLALLLYGPNTWITVTSTCEHSGEALEYRVLASDMQRVKTHTPLEAASWCVWLPTLPDSDPGPTGDQHAAISFYTQADFETYRLYHAEEPGVLYSFYEAMAFSECLYKLYHSFLSV